MLSVRMTDNDDPTYAENFRQLAALPVLSGIDADKAAEIIDEALLASLLRPRTNLQQWLIAAVTAAVEEMKESE